MIEIWGMDKELNAHMLVTFEEEERPLLEQAFKEDPSLDPASDLGRFCDKVDEIRERMKRQENSQEMS